MWRTFFVILCIVKTIDKCYKYRLAMVLDARSRNGINASVVEFCENDLEP